jgi:biopolymer transport protein ExbD
VEKPGTVVALNADDRAPYGVVADVIEELKDASAALLSFTSDREESTIDRRPTP